MLAESLQVFELPGIRAFVGVHIFHDAAEHVQFLTQCRAGGENKHKGDQGKAHGRPFR